MGLKAWFERSTDKKLFRKKFHQKSEIERSGVQISSGPFIFFVVKENVTEIFPLQNGYKYLFIQYIVVVNVMIWLPRQTL